MKKVIRGVPILIVIAAVVMLALPCEAGVFSGGDGSHESPYQIETAEQLATVAEEVYLDKHFILAADVDLSDTVWGATYAQAHSTGGWEPIGTSDDPFTGTFDGDGHTITGLYINRQDNHFVGLFGYTDGAAIQSVGLLDADVSGGTCVGGLVGFNSYTAITDSYAAGRVAGSKEDAGGLVGTNYGTITNSYATSSVEGGTHVGGLAGYNEGAIAGSHATGDVTGSGENVGGLVGTTGVAGTNYGTITNSYATGNVTGSQSCVGGLAGFSYVSITNSYATGAVDGTLYVGGLVGNNEGTIENSYASGAVNGEDYIGGLAGFNYEGTITGSHATGSVTSSGGDSVGGLAGQNQGIVTGCYATGNVNGDEDVGGLAGSNFLGVIENSYAVGAVNGYMYVGGLVGCNYPNGTITNSYATGAVDGEDYAGGLVGLNYDTITNSYAAGAVTGTGVNIGGLVGVDNSGTVTASFWDTQTTGQSGSSGGTGITIAAMKQQATFVGWDFTNTWTIAAGTYPYLGWQNDNCDFAPPVFAAGCPQADNITHNALDLLVEVDEDATAYYVVLADGDDAPTADQVKAGTGADNDLLAANCRGSIELTADIEETKAVTGLNPETAYDIYVAAEDAAGNLQPDLLTAMMAVTTAEVSDTTVNNAAIPGITHPATGGAPVTTITETEQYTGTISWNPGDDPFQGETVYTATITLTAKTGFTFEGVSADFFTVAGTTSVTNNADSGMVTAVFPETTTVPSIYEVTFTVKDSDGAAIAGAEITFNSTTLLTNAGGVATINLENGTYPYGVTKTGFHAIIDGSVTVAGSPVAEAVEMTAKSVEPDYITISATSPADGATGVSRTPTITVTFSDNIETDSGYGDITLKDAGSSTVSSSKNISGQVLTITPEGNLIYGTTYTVTVPADAVKSTDPEANLAGQFQFSFTTRPAPTGGGGGGGSPAPKPATETSKKINAAAGGTVSLGDVSVHIPAGALPGDATFSIRKLTENETDDIVPEGLRLKLAGDIYDITTTGSRDFGDNTITIKIPHDPDKIAAGEAPVISYYDEETGAWTALETTAEQDANGKWYAVVQVNHLTKFAVFSTAVVEPAQPQKVIKLTIGSTETSIDGQPCTLDAAPFVDARADRTLVPIRFVSEALGAEVEWLTETRQVIITDNGQEIILTIDSTNVLVNGQNTTIDSAPAALPPGRTFVPLRFVGETLGAQVDYVDNTKQIIIVR